MKDPFVWLDNWQSRINFFRATHHWRIAVTLLAILSAIAWAVLGFDSGIGMIQSMLSDFPSLVTGQITFQTWLGNAYALYGITGHFSAVVTYCLLFVFISKYLETVNIRGSKNLFIALNLVFFNGALFEIWYQFSYAIFQTPVYLVQWITEYLGWYICIFIGGVYTILYFWADSFHSSFRSYWFQPSKKLLLVLGAFVGSILLWYFYPFSYQIVDAPLFPQTVYAGLRYYQNDGVHLANILVKTMFAVSEYKILRQFHA